MGILLCQKPCGFRYAFLVVQTVLTNGCKKIPKGCEKFLDITIHYITLRNANNSISLYP